MYYILHLALQSLKHRNSLMWCFRILSALRILIIKNLKWQTADSSKIILFSPLGKPADRAIYFTFRNFSETNYLKIRWTYFDNRYVEWKLFGRRWWVWTSFFDISRDVAMATDFVQKWSKISYTSALIALSLQNGICYRLVDERIESCTNWSTSCKKYRKSVSSFWVKVG